MLDYLLTLKGESEKSGNKIVEYCLQMHAHNGSEFDTWIVSNNLTCERNNTEIIKFGIGIISLKVFIGYV